MAAMGRLALVGGHRFEELSPWSQAERRTVTTERGSVVLLEAGDHLLLSRHGLDAYTPAQLVDHARNLAALAEAGCDRLLAICSVGSLHAELGIGSLICPHDFIAFGRPDAAFDDERGHVIPGFDPLWRARVLEALRELSDDPVRDQGVYWQSLGPRFETPAEVRLIAEHGDVVGMTMGSECAIACQMGLAYAALCMVDNLANGVSGAQLTREQYEAGLATNRRRLASLLPALVQALAGQPA